MIQRRMALFFVMLLFLTACSTGDKQVEALLDRAESYLPLCPDSADMMLNRIDSIWGKSGADSREADYKYKLVRIMTNAIWLRSIKTDSIIRPVYMYYKDKTVGGIFSFPSSEMQRHYAQSCYYLALYADTHHNTKQAEDLYREAIKYSEKAEDWRINYLAKNRLGIILYHSNAKEGIRLQTEALEAYKKCNDLPSNYINILITLSNRYMASGESDKAFECINEAYDVAVKEKLDAKKYDCMRYASVLYFLSGNYQKSLELAKEGMGEVNRFTNSSANFILAISYMAQDSLEQAREAFLNIRSADKLENVAVYQNLCKIAIMQNDTASARVFADSIVFVTNKVVHNIQKAKDDYYHDVIQREHHEEKLSHQKWMLITWLMVILLFLIFFVFYHRRTNRLRRQAYLMKRKHEIETHNLYVMEQQRQHENDQKLIHQKSITLALLQKYFIAHVSQVKANLIDKEDIRLTNETWQEIEDLLDASENNFVKKLRQQHKDFEEDDIRMCILTRMKVKNKVLADIFHISVDAIKKRKSTLKKNGFGVDDPNVTLEQIIEGIC